MKTTTLPSKYSVTRSSYPFALLIPLVLAYFALSPPARAVCQEGCDLINDNTFLGDDALINNTTGFSNMAIGSFALSSNTSGNTNTATGASALTDNTTGIDNTATGVAALFFNTTGSSNTATGVAALQDNTTGNENTATGLFALFFNTIGNDNTATGIQALFSNTTGDNNTATGAFALQSNTTGFSNTANGWSALNKNTTGTQNTAIGLQALWSNTSGSDNTAVGFAALNNNTDGINNTATGFQALEANTTGNFNTATGQGALFLNTTGRNNTADGQNALRGNTIGSNNIALGVSAGINLSTGSNNIDIGNRGVSGEANRIRIGKQGTQTAAYIAGISGATVPTGVPVIVDSTGHLGTTTSSARFKKEIKPMDRASEAIHALKPVTFRYKDEFDPNGIAQFGLVAEDVEKVNPDLVARDEQGKPYTVRYEAVNAMLLNEFLKAHRTVEWLEKAMAEQRKENAVMRAMLNEQAAQIQKVSAQLELSDAEPQTVLNNQ